MIFSVEGITCGHCVTSITREIQAIHPAAQVHVDLARRQVEALGELSVSQAQAAIEAAGYTARVLDAEDSPFSAAPAATCCGTCGSGSEQAPSQIR